MIGFKASNTWIENQFETCPPKDEIYVLIFNNLGLEILHLKNNYRSGSVSNVINISPIVPSLYEAAEEQPLMLISTLYLSIVSKRNKSTENGGI